MRKSGGEDVGELAALIKAQGLLQNLVVHPAETKRGKSTGDYGVAAGGRRLRALGLLAKAGDIPLDKDILCRLITRDAAIAASVAQARDTPSALALTPHGTPSALRSASGLRCAG